MFGSREQNAQLLGLLIVAILVYSIRRIREHDGAANAINAIVSNCEFARPGVYRSGPYPASMKWCNRSSETLSLMHHMRVKCANMDACIAAEFGSLVSIGYITPIDLFIINPVIEKAPGSAMISCLVPHYDHTGEHTTQIMRHNPVEVTFIDETLKPSKRTLYNRGACLVHAMDAAMRGHILKD